MKIYLAGNFPQLSSPPKEKAMMEEIIAMGYEYNRLITFYYPKYMMTVINLVKEGGQNDGGKKKARLRKRRELSG